MESTTSKKTKEYFIGKVTEDDIRKAYFKGQLFKMLAKIQEDQEINDEELAKLEEFLKGLRDKEGTLIENLKDYIPEYAEDGAFKSLKNEDPAQVQSQNIVDNREKAIKLVNNLIYNMGNKYLNNKTPNPNKEELMNMVFQLVSVKCYIDEEKLYREQLYKKKIIEFEQYGKQRKTAEEYAKVTSEYADYRRMADLNKRIETFSMASIKRYGGI